MNQGVGQDHMHDEALTEIILVNTVMLFVESTTIILLWLLIIATIADMKIMTKVHCCHRKSNYSTTEDF